MPLHEMPIRLALRREGSMIKAYLANQGTMDNAILLSTLDYKVSQNEEIFTAWKGVMIRTVEIMIEEVFHEVPLMMERPAPGHEREQ